MQLTLILAKLTKNKKCAKLLFGDGALIEKLSQFYESHDLNDLTHDIESFELVIIVLKSNLL